MGSTMHVMTVLPVSLADVEWGPVAVWVSAAASLLSSLVAILIALGAFDRFRAPQMRISFEPTQPWCRPADAAVGENALWVRVGVENIGRMPARGCVGRLIGVTTDDVVRPDVDPIQLRWAGRPRARQLDPLDLRHDQREFLNVLVLHEREGVRLGITTFEGSDFNPGFPTELLPGHEHVLRIAVFADNAATASRYLVANVRATDDKEVILSMQHHAPKGVWAGEPVGKGR